MIAQEKAAPQPDLKSLIDCLSRLDGKTHVIVDRKGQVLAVSGEALMDAGQSAATAGQLLIFTEDRAEEQAIAQRLLAVRGDKTDIAILEPVPHGEPVLVRAAAIDEHHVWLVLAPSKHNGSRWIPEMQKLFGLTACEAQIIADLMDGRAPQAIAERRQNSIHTIRAHIRQCHQKIGVKSREELFSRIAIVCR